jgi:hypothetical protein
MAVPVSYYFNDSTKIQWCKISDREQVPMKVVHDTFNVVPDEGCSRYGEQPSSGTTLTYREPPSSGTTLTVSRTTFIRHNVNRIVNNLHQAQR